MPKNTKPVPFAAIESRIHLIRRSKVMLDADLAELYGVTTGNLNKALQRNRERFPDDFIFQLAPGEFKNLIFQSGISSRHGGRRHMPFAFTQEGIAMLSSVLRSPRAVAVNVEIMRAFIRMRGLLISVDELARKLEALERKALAHDTPANRRTTRLAYSASISASASRNSVGVMAGTGDPAKSGTLRVTI